MGRASSSFEGLDPPSSNFGLDPPTSNFVPIVVVPVVAVVPIVPVADVVVPVVAVVPVVPVADCQSAEDVGNDDPPPWPAPLHAVRTITVILWDA